MSSLHLFLDFLSNGNGSNVRALTNPCSGAVTRLGWLEAALDH